MKNRLLDQIRKENVREKEKKSEYFLIYKARSRFETNSFLVFSILLIDKLMMMTTTMIIFKLPL